MSAPEPPDPLLLERLRAGAMPTLPGAIGINEAAVIADAWASELVAIEHERTMARLASPWTIRRLRDAADLLAGDGWDGSAGRVREVADRLETELQT